MTKEKTKIKGVITKVFFTKGTWSSIALYTDDCQYIKASGTIFEPHEEMEIELTGVFETHPTYGLQFKVEKSNPVISFKKDAMIKYLSSSFIKDCGEKKAYLIVEKFGKKTYDIIEKDYLKLTEIPGIGNKTALNIHESYIKNRSFTDLINFFDGEITENQVLKIFDYFGEKALEKIKKNPYILVEINGIGFLKADKLALSSGIDYKSIHRVKAAAIFALRENADLGDTYCELDTLDSIVLNILLKAHDKKYEKELKADKTGDFAKKLEVEKVKLKAEFRVILADALVELFDFQKDQIVYEKAQIIKGPDVYIVNEVYDDRVVCFERTTNIKKTFSKRDIVHGRNDGLVLDDDRVYLPDIYIAENDSAGYIKKKLSIAPTPVSCDIDKLIKEKEYELGFSFDKKQVDAVKEAVNNNILVITGGPGMGKTTIIQLIVESLGKNNVILSAPTGKAAKRMMDATGTQAMTCYKLVNSKYEVLNTYGDINGKTFIVDESSMLDLTIAYQLLKLSDTNRIIFVGDVDQLPSIGVGSFLRDLIESPEVPTVKLEYSYRFGGTIAQNALLINHGNSLGKLHKDTLFSFTECERDIIKNVIISAYKEALTEYEPKDIMLLVPARKRTFKSSAEIMNMEIRQIVNPNGKNIPGTEFKEGDRVMVTSNSYRKICYQNGNEVLGIFNGDCGTIKKSLGYEACLVQFDDGRDCYFDKYDFLALQLAYAFTIHKAQGSEAKACIIAMNKEHYTLLNRNLFYTAVTRAKERVMLLGDTWSFNQAIRNTMPITRKSWLINRLY